jgi:V8-like Glu-specific endopeptidase
MMISQSRRIPPRRLHALLISILVLIATTTFVNGVVVTAIANADTVGGGVGHVAKTLYPSISGNGRALAFDPASTNLYYTNLGDPHIYVITNTGSAVRTLNSVSANGSPIQYGALSWDPEGGGILWAGRYDGSGMIDKVNPMTGAVTPAFTFAFSLGESCYNQAPGFIDGLAFDKAGHTLWLSDDAAVVIHHVRTNGAQISSTPVPAGTCNSGIADDGNSLWLGLLSGPDTPPFFLARVAKSDPTTILNQYNFGNDVGPEGLALDGTSYTDACLLWSNQYGNRTVITATKIPSLLCQGGATKFGNNTDPMGVLLFNDKTTGMNGQCSATLVQSKSQAVIVTAAHCVSNGHVVFSDYRFAPAHTGGIDDLQGKCAPESCSGFSPYGIWAATASGVVMDKRYNSNADHSYDYAFIVMAPNSAGEQIGQISPSLPVQFNQGRNQPWVAYGFPSGGPLTTCSTGNPASENADGFVNGDPPYMTMNCNTLTEGSSGGPWIAATSQAVGGVNSQFVSQFIGGDYLRGTYLGCQASWDFKKAEHMAPGGGPMIILPPNC